MRAMLLLLASLATAAAAQDTDFERVLLADTSGSLTSEELSIQREGYAATTTDP
ncbi:hypothetical protein GCM10011415_42040 [Salipiger pallidus]|uniref:Uncharacterized protein n=1 Tax=Salipiger pallidus TaxID=1775170 RepID=A0A8J3EII6_9RHOB|nr:hypothetical protein [Salipiger pallidus]GGG87129.1 hypothetical protein GCM10011415_42040 [Salipiger pallidus]